MLSDNFKEVCKENPGGRIESSKEGEKRQKESIGERRCIWEGGEKMMEVPMEDLGARPDDYAKTQA